MCLAVSLHFSHSCSLSDKVFTPVSLSSSAVVWLISLKQWHRVYCLTSLYSSLSPTFSFFYVHLTFMLVCTLCSNVFTPVALSCSAFLCRLALSCLGPTALIGSHGRQTAAVHVRVTDLKLCLQMFANIFVFL